MMNVEWKHIVTSLVWTVSMYLWGKSFTEWHLFPQAASVHDRGQSWALSHHLHLWHHMHSQLQVLFSDGEGPWFSQHFLWMRACTMKKSSLASVWICMYEVSVFLCRVIVNGVMIWWSSGQAATRNSHTLTWSRRTAPPASSGHFSEHRKLARWAYRPYTSIPPSARKLSFKGINRKTLNSSSLSHIALCFVECACCVCSFTNFYFHQFFFFLSNLFSSIVFLKFTQWHSSYNDSNHVCPEKSVTFAARPQQSIWSHSAGERYLLFCFFQERKYSSDVAKIYSIHITNVIGGVASQCRHCALSSAEVGSACVPCPLGHYMVNGTGMCQSCPSNTFIRADQPIGEEACVPCGPNTERNKVTGTRKCVKNNLVLKVMKPWILSWNDLNHISLYQKVCSLVHHLIFTRAKSSQFRLQNPKCSLLLLLPLADILSTLLILKYVPNIYGTTSLNCCSSISLIWYDAPCWKLQYS